VTDPVEWLKTFVSEMGGEAIMTSVEVSTNFYTYHREYNNVGRAAAHTGMTWFVGWQAGAYGASVGLAAGTSVFAAALSSGVLGGSAIAISVVASLPVALAFVGGFVIGAAAVIAVQALYDFNPAFKNTVNDVGDALNWTGDRIGDGFNLLGDAFNWIGDSVKSIGQGTSVPLDNLKWCFGW
jgi:hypothetical protein